MNQPKFINDDAFRALRAGDVDAFHRMTAGRATIDFTEGDLRAADLRKADLSKVILRGAYLKLADLRGCDLRHMDLEGCSLHQAKIGGTYFPLNVAAEEIRLSVQEGTRIRVGTAR
ncbi:MAG: pentapeptide repeat-containing protein [Planctomycetia bacterium]|nr:pentapeptide repeat-containing protein [Planctomycetia bacterium]